MFVKGYTPHNKSHGMTHTPTYNSWINMRRRCSEKHSGKYGSYFDKGIRVCDRWKDSFENFYIDMGDRPPNKTLDRIDNARDYEPSNCKWSTPTEQNLNKSRPREWGTKLSFGNKYV